MNMAFLTRWLMAPILLAALFVSVAGCGSPGPAGPSDGDLPSDSGGLSTGDAVTGVLLPTSVVVDVTLAPLEVATWPTVVPTDPVQMESPSAPDAGLLVLVATRVALLSTMQDRASASALSSVGLKQRTQMDLPDMMSPSAAEWGAVLSTGRVDLGGLRPEAGGNRNPNDGLLPLVYFEGHGVNPFVDADEDPFSTFSLDGDTASMEVARLYLGQGTLPPPDSVRLEEWVNSFSSGYSGQESGLGLRLDGMVSPFGESDDYRLLRVGVASARPTGDRGPVSLIFVVDISGSMGWDGRLDVAKTVMRGLVQRLGVSDRVGLVTYGDSGGVDYPMTGVADSEGLLGRILELSPGGSTNVEEGIVAAYVLAADELDSGQDNVRLVVFSDGVGNLGATGPASVLKLVDQAAQRGASLTVVGVGVGGNYNDVMLEALANRGNGTYHYVRSEEQANRFLEEGAESVFRDVARDARVQVEFRPDVVRKYRLLGYENRAVADDDFREDDLDFGELGFARDVTALYELRLQTDFDGDDELAVVRLRWRDSATGDVLQNEAAVTVDDVSSSVADAAAGLVVAVAVAEFAELMRRSYWAQCGTLEAVSDLLAAAEEVEFDDVVLPVLLDQAIPLFEIHCST